MCRALSAQYETTCPTPRGRAPHTSKPTIASNIHNLQSKIPAQYGPSTAVHNHNHTPAGGEATGAGATAAEDGQPNRGHQHHHGSTGPTDAHGTASAGPGSVGRIHAGVGGPHRRVPEGNTGRPSCSNAAKPVAQPQAGSTRYGPKPATTTPADGKAGTGTTGNANQHRYTTSTRRSTNRNRPPTSEQRAAPGVPRKEATSFPAAPSGATDGHRTSQPNPPNYRRLYGHRGHRTGSDRHFRDNQGPGNIRVDDGNPNPPNTPGGGAAKHHLVDSEPHKRPRLPLMC